MLMQLHDGLCNPEASYHPETPHRGAPHSYHTVKEITMHDHTGHTPNKPPKPAPPTKGAPATPAQPDPHAGHDMGKPQKPGTPQQGAEKK
jgi:hypothetical protein